MSQFNANQFPDVYSSFGIQISELGVVMLDTDAIEVTEMVDQGKKDLYESQNPAFSWVSGAVAERGAHCTLLFGLLQKAYQIKPQITAVLDGWVPPRLEVDKVTSFPSSLPGEEYACIIAKLKVTPELLEGNQRLSLLPHINTFPTYEPHISLAYVKKEAEQKWIKALSAEVRNMSFDVNGLNYGGASK